jgi:hypothetical protein
VLKELVHDTTLTQRDLEALEQGPAPPIVDEVRKVQKPYWPSL